MELDEETLTLLGFGDVTWTLAVKLRERMDDNALEARERYALDPSKQQAARARTKVNYQRTKAQAAERSKLRKRRLAQSPDFRRKESERQRLRRQRPEAKEADRLRQRARRAAQRKIAQYGDASQRTSPHSMEQATPVVPLTVLAMTVSRSGSPNARTHNRLRESPKTCSS